MQFDKTLKYLTYPFKAIVSRRFYFEVMSEMAGVGITYLFLLCAAIALPATYQVKAALATLQSYELSTVVGKIPPSYIDTKGVLSPTNPDDAAAKVIYNSKGQAILAYNLENGPIDGLNESVPITITSHAAILNTHDGTVTVPWTSVYGNAGSQFEPLEMARALEQAFNSSYYTVWLMVTLWMFSMLAFIVLIAGAATKAIGSIFVKTKVSYATALRLSSYGATLAAFLMLSQFFFNISFSYIMLAGIPICYTISFLVQLRKVIEMCIADPKFALSARNPLRQFYESQSRVREDNTVDHGPAYDDLDEAGRFEREENLRRIFKRNADNIRMNMMHQQHNNPYQNQSQWPNSNEQRNDNGMWPNANDESSKNNEPSSFNEQQDSNATDNQAKSNDERKDNEVKPNPYAYNAKDDDDSIFNDNFDDLPERGEVKKGGEGKDSSFTP